MIHSLTDYGDNHDQLLETIYYLTVSWLSLTIQNYCLDLNPVRSRCKGSINKVWRTVMPEQSLYKYKARFKPWNTLWDTRFSVYVNWLSNRGGNELF